MLTVEQVLVIQRNLQSYGYLYKQPDGVWDETTQSGYRNWLARYKHVFTSNIPYPLSIQGIPPQLLGYDVEEDFLAPKPSIDTTQEPDTELPAIDDSEDERGYEYDDSDDERGYDVEEETEIEDEVEEDEEEE